MKKLLFIILLLSSICVNGTVYHVASSGGDYSTIAEVNAATFSPGDQILFNRGESFYGTLIVSQSGSSGNPIIYGAYGTGADPVITGFTQITSGWTDEGGGIYSKVITSDAQTNMVTIDGVEYGMGRYPNSSYLIYESASGHTSITDNQLSSTPIWTGAEVVIRKNDWQLDRCLITNHSGTTITYSNTLSSLDATSGNGYFIQNSIKTLDQYGEWYHDTSSGKFYMYFGAINPITKIVRVATKIYCITLSGQTYVTIDGLSIIGSISNAIQTNSQSNDLTIKNCSIDFAGSYGAYINSQNSSINNNTISNCNQGAVRCLSSLVNITNNTISKIGLIKGSSPIYYSAIMGTANDGGLIQYNKIDSVGYNGIFIKGVNSTIKNNFINHCCLILNDGGGIYTANTNTGMVIDHNIVLNTYGNHDGGNTPISISEGIYLDEPASGITVADNTCAYNGYSGIKLHRANTCVIDTNTCFYNGYAEIYILNSSTTNSTLYDDTIRANQFITASSTSYTVRYKDVGDPNIVFGFADNNYYTKPTNISASLVELTLKNASTIYKTLSGWQTVSSQDANSHISTQFVSSVSDLYFYYSLTDTIITLPYAMVDVTGTKYASTLTLTPYTSKVLMIDANPYTSPAGRKYIGVKGKYFRINGKYLK